MNRWRTESEYDLQTPHAQRFIGLQPILDRSRNTFGYELLFRSGWENRFTGDAETSSRTIINDTLSYGLDSLVGDGVPFVNCTHSLLTENIVSLLPTGTVLEILETVAVDEALVVACKQLKANGYRIALDDFDFHPRWQPLLAIADFIKIDFRASNSDQRLGLIRQLENLPVLFIAEKVEDEQEFRTALWEGFHLFQGYFFMRPTVVATPALQAVMQRLRLMSELRNTELDTIRILHLLKEETSIALRVLRLANTVEVGSREKTTDLRTALVVIGVERFRHLALAALTAEIVGRQPPELYKQILQRGRYCELMANPLNHDSEQMFFFGVLSVVAPVLRLTREEVDQTLTLPSRLQDALFASENEYQVLLQTMANYEQGRWDGFAENALYLEVLEENLAKTCREAQEWAMQVTSMV